MRISLYAYIFLGMIRLMYAKLQDVVASLHSYFTCNLLIAFSIIISFKQFGGRPMECMLPMGFNGAWEQVSSFIDYQLFKIIL